MSGETGVLSRRRALQVLAVAGVTGPAAVAVLAQAREPITPEALEAALTIVKGDLEEGRAEVVATALQWNLDQFQVVRDLEIDDLVEPAPILVAGWR